MNIIQYLIYVPTVKSRVKIYITTTIPSDANRNLRFPKENIEKYILAEYSRFFVWKTWTISDWQKIAYDKQVKLKT